MNATSAETDEVQRIQLAPVDSDNESHGMRCCANVETYGRVLRWGIVHNLITYYKLDKKGFMLTYKAGRRVVAVNSKGRVAFDIDIRRDVLIAGRTRLRALRALVARQSSIGEEEKEVVDERAPDDALGRAIGRLCGAVKPEVQQIVARFLLKRVLVESITDNEISNSLVATGTT
ncbi:hypothetical protein PC118_g5746 [Phytophthora cactorum]|uniref:Uncharacterized protein n=1 Tax=Phytophthora cactorum TaxID=29920 RepID=A0A8T1GAP3_9STRA|nr:hypothetical protein PC118_g5746 [Phytophthora cactorum]